MVPRPLLYVLVFAFPILIVSFAVVMGAFLLFDVTGDSVASSSFRRAGFVILGLAIVDAVLLLGALGIRALQPDAQDTEEESE